MQGVKAPGIAQMPLDGHHAFQPSWLELGKRLKGHATRVKAVPDTQRARLTVYVEGRVFKRWPYKFLNK